MKAEVRLFKITKIHETEPNLQGGLAPEFQMADLFSFVRAENA